MPFDKYIKQILLFIFFAFIVQKQISAQLSRNKIIGAYVYNFAKHIKIEKNKDMSTFNIVLVSDNQEIIDEFVNIEKTQKVNNKPIVLSVTRNSKIDYNKACLIFVAEDKSEIYSEIFSKTANQQILIVSENYDNKRKVMLNLYDTEDNKILFEINKGNIYERKIKISDELLLMGGTEIDLVKLYINSQKQLNESEKELSKLRSDIQILNFQFKEAHDNAILQLQQIKKQDQLIKNQKNEKEKLLLEIKQQQEELQNNRSEINVQQKHLLKEKTRLSQLSDSLILSKTLLKRQKKELNDGLFTLKKLEDEIRTKNREVRVQESTLGDQYEIINKQKKINNLFIIIILLGIILTVGLLIGFIYRKKKNNLLDEQKEELRQKNEAIADHLEKKKLINNLLKEKNEELSSIIEELKNTQQQLVQSEKMASLGVLTAGIAHEINNPINFVFAGVNSLQKDFDDIETVIKKINELKPDDDNLKEKITEIQELKKEYYFDDALEAIPEIISGIKEGATRTAEIIDGLRTFARMDDDKLMSINLNESINASLLILKSKYKNIIEVIRDYSDIPNVKCNSGKISQVIVNVIANAIDALLDIEKEIDKKKITITTRTDTNYVILSIKDNGQGIPDNIKTKIFDPFFTTKKIGKGTGLGLSISYNIIKEHKGKMEVITEIGTGSEFLIYLPLI